ncbi:BLUF domain-containing protein [Yoonia sp. F2084L]|uniref:BLUF domain-containing protein n=1 Tax=Yoonia sp. F2084L TaxID=2926419 RepID=UPI001FF1FB54|nr:BLUF domain-containing protein [Yoonia sp. F2084L]MCK0095532.1 BLUF domain-containing protein [Yoonia sp. F2084L]
MSYLQIVYASRPFGFDASTLLSILFHARAHNAQSEVTGCLICRDDIYLQLLEGPAHSVRRIYGKIQQDDRHVEVTELLRHDVSERLFGKWAMRDDPVQSWMWTREQINAGAFNHATTEEVMGIFQRLAQQVSETEE